MFVWECSYHGALVQMDIMGAFFIAAGNVYFGPYQIVCADCEVDDNPAPQFRDDDK